MLVGVQQGMRLEAATARSWAALVADVHAKHGVTLTISTPAGAYRDDALVRDMYLNKAKYGIKKSQPVAKPRSLGGKGSVHETGRCIDIWNHADVPRRSLVALAAAHGFTFTIPTEPWHVQHDGSGGGGGAGGGGIPDEEDDEMKTLYFPISDDGAAALGIHKGDCLVRSAPDRPLMRVTTGQLTELWAADGVDGSAPTTSGRVFPKPGSWALAAVAEDEANRVSNVAMHPWLAATPDAVSADLSPVLDAIAAVPAAVIVEQKKPGN